MCRWAAWVGKPIFLEDIILRPSHSLVEQSKNAEECKTSTNADGFGVAWYDQRPEPGLYRDVYPAWSVPNLSTLSRQVQSGLFMAHVRASTGTAISRNNCHPFAVGNWTFMHNGQIGGFDGFRKQADMLIPDVLYGDRRGATDSEVLFLLALGHGLDRDPNAAMARAVAELQSLSHNYGTTPHMRMSAAFSDGRKLYALRFASDARAPTLYYRQDVKNGGWAVASEPLDSDANGWTALPAGQLGVFSSDGLEIQNFTPETLQPQAA